MHQRIKNIDGLRAFAALGVLWIHCWNTGGNPRYLIWGIDFANVLALGGNGVDLFFVISGFCMYYFYSRADFSWPDFWLFLKRRWSRLSPAFYTATVFYIVMMYSLNDTYPVIQSLATSVFYLNSILERYNAAGLFWTLSVEWQFYLVIPFILIYQQKMGFMRIFTLILLDFLIFDIVMIILLKKSSDVFSSQIFFRYFEFMWGIMAAWLFMNHPGKIANQFLWIIIFVIATYTGRILISKSLMSLSENYYNFIKLSGFTIMSLGFAGILYIALDANKWLSFLLGNKLISTIGSVSYSFYLWHGLIIHFVQTWITSYFHTSQVVNPFVLFFCSFILILPGSMLSYRYLEKPFLRSKVKLT